MSVRAFTSSGISSLKLLTGLDTPKSDGFTLKVFSPESAAVAGTYVKHRPKLFDVKKMRPV